MELPMLTLSAFADEIDPDPERQVAVLRACDIRFIELRSVHLTNVLDLTDLEVRELHSLLHRHGFGLSAIGSPIGKIRISEPFEPHLKRFRKALDLCRSCGTRNLRLFSYYLAENSTWDQWRQEVLDRMSTKVKLAEQAGVRLLHENEQGIYGDAPERVLDLLTTFDSPAFQAVFDPANYVFCGYDPWHGWELTRDRTAHFHIKDWIQGEPHGRMAGEGHGRIADVMADAVARNYEGFATLEPHLLGGGPTGGVTGLDLFPKAVAAFKSILSQVGATYE
jgi:sugar phosphate isomerase/epimerase